MRDALVTSAHMNSIEERNGVHPARKLDVILVGKMNVTCVVYFGVM